MSRLLALILLALVPTSSWATKIVYAEQWYKLVHRHLSEGPDEALENIYYLERALRADFANPLNALTPIRDQKEWERYRALFRMHVNLLLVQQTLILGANYDKQQAYFYNYPWKWANLDSLQKAEQIYQTAFGYWKDAQTYAAEAANTPPPMVREPSVLDRRTVPHRDRRVELHPHHSKATRPTGRRQGKIPGHGTQHLLICSRVNA